MDFYAAIGLDVAAVAIVVYCMYAAAKKGFVRTVIQMIAYVAVLLTASFLSSAAAPVIYDRVVEPMLLEQRERLFEGESSYEPQMRVNAELVSTVPRGMLSSAGDAIEDALNGALGSLDEIMPDPQELADDLLDDLTEVTIRPLMISAIRMIGFVVVFALLSMIANCLLSALGIINHLPVVGAVNGFLGGGVGIVQGLLLVWVLAVLLQGLLHLYPGGWWIFSQETVDRSWLFKYFMDIDRLRQLYN